MKKSLLSVLSATAVGIGMLIAAPVASQAATGPMLPVSLTASVGYRAGTSTSHKAPAGRTGYAQLGTNRYPADFRYNNKCVQGSFAYGTLKAPKTVGWKTWMS